MTQISSLTAGYSSGMLSVFPEAIDDRISLYDARNNATTQLRQSLPYSGKQIIVNDASLFPDQGLLRIGPAPGNPGRIMVPDGGSFSVNGNEIVPGDSELIYYGAKAGNVFSDLIRGFAGSRQSQWNANDYCSSGVMAEHHNAIKDAILKLMTKLGTKDLPASESLNGILQELERVFLSPKPIFRAVPRSGSAPLKVRFQNFSGGDPVRYLWDFGDGSQSTEVSPIHTYTSEGIYSVKLNVITTLGAQGVATKSNYITVNNEEGIVFFYSESLVGNSQQTSPTNPTVFRLVDQSDGPIVERIWDFDDGTRITVSDPNQHVVDHVYNAPGTYQPVLMVVFSDLTFRRIVLNDVLLVS